MIDNGFFTSIDTQALVTMIEQAEQSIIYAAPGLRDSLVAPLIQASEDLGEGMVIVCLDVSEQSVRMGYGEHEGLEVLNEFVIIQNIPYLRFGLIIVDGKGYSFTPNALYLESEQSNALGFNAIKLTPQQIKEATIRLSPAAKSIAMATCVDEQERLELAAIEPNIPNNPVSDATLDSVYEALTKKPPVKFDVSRQVRVYNSYLQYVEVSMTGAAIQRQKIAMPKSLQSLGTENTELEGRLKTSFDLLEKDNTLSSKALEKELKDIRDKFTSSLGKDKGRVLLVRNKPLFEEKMRELESKLVKHGEYVAKNLQHSIDVSEAKIVEMYAGYLKVSPSENMLIRVGQNPEDSKIIAWVLEQLENVFPAADDIINKMELRWDFKDLTYETLKKKDFIENVKRVFKFEDWDKAHQEYIAVSETSEEPLNKENA